MYFQSVIKAFQQDIKAEKKKKENYVPPDFTKSQFVHKLKMSLMKEKYPSVPYYNVERGHQDFQVLPDVIMDYDVEEQKGEKFSNGLKKRYNELKKQMRELEEKQRKINLFASQRSKCGLTRRNSFS